MRLIGAMAVSGSGGVSMTLVVLLVGLKVRLVIELIISTPAVVRQSLADEVKLAEAVSSRQLLFYDSSLIKSKGERSEFILPLTLLSSG